MVVQVAEAVVALRQSSTSTTLCCFQHRGHASFNVNSTFALEELRKIVEGKRRTGRYSSKKRSHSSYKRTAAVALPVHDTVEALSGLDAGAGEHVPPALVVLSPHLNLFVAYCSCGFSSRKGMRCCNFYLVRQ